MTTVIDRPPTPTAPDEGPAEPRPSGLAAVSTKWWILITLVVWLIGWAVFKGQDTLTLGGADTTAFHRWLNDIKSNLDSARETNFFLREVIGGISTTLDSTVEFLRELLSIPAFPRPVPQVGWFGVIGLLTWVAYALAGLRGAIMMVVSLLLFGYLGYWEDSIDLLIITFVAVAICVVIGIPIGILMARSKVATTILTPILDTMQTIPSFAYLTPLTLLFGIGSASAVVVTLVYAIPPLIRITAHGVRSVAPGTVEAARSIGVTRGQLLRKIQLPMARRTIVVGINQCTMAALSMATIAAYVDGPGLGQPVTEALQSLDVGSASVSGLAIVIMAIMLDRITTAASERSEVQRRKGKVRGRRDTYVLAGLGVGAIVSVWLSRQYLTLADFPTSPDLGKPLSEFFESLTNWVVDNFDGVTNAIKDAVSYGLLNPMQSLLADSPWWLTAAVILALAFLLGGWRPTVVSIACIAVILGTGLWNESMNTLTTVLVATLVALLIALVVGVWMGRSKRADLLLRPLLDALQTIPPFVYLVPALALFGTSRFTAIVAAVAYGVPIASKLIADGIRGVAPTSVEAARSAGTTAWQMISKVQLPMSRAAVVLATNQGLLYVLSMVVIGGLVGGGGLGYLVVRGFRQEELFGKGLAAAIAITALGIMLDRIAQHAAARFGQTSQRSTT